MRQSPSGLDLELSFDGWKVRVGEVEIRCTMATFQVGSRRIPLNDDLVALSIGDRLVIRSPVSVSVGMPEAHADWIVLALRWMRDARSRTGEMPPELLALMER